MAVLGIAFCLIGVSPAFSDSLRPLESALASTVSVLPVRTGATQNPAEPEGSGVAVFDGSYIITALHVIGKIRKINVRTSAGDIARARVVGRDKATDLALLQIESKLPTLQVATLPRLGDEVCAVGNAFGLGLSVTCGTVSAVHRAGTGFNPVEDFIQTDAAVNPGASGGALVTKDGKLAGILSAIFTKSSDANIGVNFAVSADLALKVAKSLRDDGAVQWNFGGLILKQYPARGEPGRLGARIVRIRDVDAAEVAGLKKGDIIHDVNQRRIRKPKDFYSVAATLSPGQAMTITFSRNGEEQTTEYKPN